MANPVKHNKRASSCRPEGIVLGRVHLVGEGKGSGGPPVFIVVEVSGCSHGLEEGLVLMVNDVIEHRDLVDILGAEVPLPQWHNFIENVL